MNMLNAVVHRFVFALMLGTVIVVIAAAGGGWLLLFGAVLAAHFARRRWPGSGISHGAAAFATESQIRAAGMTERGFHIGELVVAGPRLSVVQAAGQMLTAPLDQSPAVVEAFRLASGTPPPRVRLWASGSGHGSVVAATRSGKGSGLIVPTLLTYPGPIFMANDPKAENYRFAVEARRAMGRQVYCIDPYELVFPGGGCRYNWLEWVAPDDPFVPDLARDAAKALVLRTGQEKETFFHDASELLIQTAIVAVLWGSRPGERNLVSAADILSDEKLLANTLTAMQNAKVNDYGGVLQSLARQCAQLSGREKASVLMSISAQHLAFLNSAFTRAALSGSDFDPLWLKNSSADLFICIPPDKLKSAAGFTRFLLTGILKRLASGRPDESRPVMVILDEAASLGRLEILEQAVTLMAGWGVKLIFVWQSIGQIRESFPGDKATTFLANMSLQVYGKTNDIETAKHISACIGARTVLATNVQKSGSSSRSGGIEARQASWSDGTSWSVTQSETAAPLLRPEEILKMPAELMVVLTDRTPPILCRQRRFYESHFWDFAKGRVKTLAQVLVVVVACILVGQALDRLPRAAPVSPAIPSNTPSRDAGRPTGGAFPPPVPRTK